jgi:glycerol-3-phosphate dehydrogenase
VEGNRELNVEARVVINATGPFTDGVRHMAEANAPALIAPSQGIHLVFDRSFLPGTCAIMVPHTPDGRVMFAIPWQGHTLVGTTDTAVPDALLEPRPLEEEIAFVLDTAGRYFSRPPARGDILSAFAGIRPLVRGGENRITAALSRDHTIHLDASGLLTVTGGKWTTYRHMAADAVDRAAVQAGLPQQPSVTSTLRLHGYSPDGLQRGSLGAYGTDAEHIQQLMRDDAALAEPLHPALPCTGAQVIWAARAEMARTVEDVLARRCRALFLNARAAIAMAPRTAALLARELGRSADWQLAEVDGFAELARRYLVNDA